MILIAGDAAHGVPFVFIKLNLTRLLFLAIEYNSFFQVRDIMTKSNMVGCLGSAINWF